MSPTAEQTFDLTLIKFGGVTHLAFVRSQMAGFQTWKSDAAYWIELTFRDGAAILTEYDQRDKWEAVINLIETRMTP